MTFISLLGNVDVSKLKVGIYHHITTIYDGQSTRTWVDNKEYKSKKLSEFMREQK